MICVIKLNKCTLAVISLKPHWNFRCSKLLCFTDGVVFKRVWVGDWIRVRLGGKMFFRKPLNFERSETSFIRRTKPANIFGGVKKGRRASWENKGGWRGERSTAEQTNYMNTNQRRCEGILHQVLSTTQLICLWSGLPGDSCWCHLFSSLPPPFL